MIAVQKEWRALRNPFEGSWAKDNGEQQGCSTWSSQMACRGPTCGGWPPRPTRCRLTEGPERLPAGGPRVYGAEARGPGGPRGAGRPAIAAFSQRDGRGLRAGGVLPHYLGRKTLKDPDPSLGRGVVAMPHPGGPPHDCEHCAADLHRLGRPRERRRRVRKRSQCAGTEEEKSSLFPICPEFPNMFYLPPRNKERPGFQGNVVLWCLGPVFFRSEGAAGEGEEEVGSQRADSARIRWLAVVATTRAGRRGGRLGHLPVGGPITSWNSPRMLAVQKDWQALDSSYAGTWSQYNIKAQNEPRWIWSSTKACRGPTYGGWP